MSPCKLVRCDIELLMELKIKMANRFQSGFVFIHFDEIFFWGKKTPSYLAANCYYCALVPSPDVLSKVCIEG